MEDHNYSRDSPEGNGRGRYPRDIETGSPSGSLASRSSSTRRENRIVELLQESESNDSSHGDDNWMIGANFYEEDVAAVGQQGSDDELSIGSEQEVRDRRDINDHNDDGHYENSDEDYDDIIDGFVIAPNEDDVLSSSDESGTDGSESDDGIVRGEITNYDITLPGVHRYLGENFEELRGMQIFDSGHTTSLPLFNLDFVVLPGQILPLTVYNSNYRVSAQFRECIQHSPNVKPLVGLMLNPRENIVGTTAEIQSYSNQPGEIKMILEGRQRFRLISSPFDSTVIGTVKILPEMSLGRPFTRIPSWQKFVTKPSTDKRFIVSKHPHFIMKNHEAASMVNRIAELISNWCTGNPKRDASDFSFWVAANLPISDKERMNALTFDCTEARLAWLLRIIEGSEFFACGSCKHVICHRKEVFPMSCSGPQNSFVNSHGFIHDTLTVRNTWGLLCESEWSDECSWFPSYLWRIARCANCGRHVGWRYKTKEPNLKPKRFFGLSRLSVRLQSLRQTPDNRLPLFVDET